MIPIDTAQGMLENTLVWFMSDNGGLNPASNLAGLVNWSRRLVDWFGKPLPFTVLEFLRTNALDGGSDNTPYRKGKNSIYEGGARVPSVLYWKGQISPTRSTQMVTVQDVLPTILSAANVNGLKEPAGVAGLNQRMRPRDRCGGSGLRCWAGGASSTESSEAASSPLRRPSMTFTSPEIIAIKLSWLRERAAQARKLCKIARPARFGWRQETLADEAVRDTCEIARSRVKIDQRRWKKTLEPRLQAIRVALGGVW